MADDQEHYLKRELYQRLRDDPVIFDFIESGSLDGIWYWDVEQPEEEWLSPRFKALFGYRDDEIPNNSAWWQENIHPDDLGVALENFQKHCADPDHPYDQIVRYRHKDGSTVWVRCRGMAIRDEAGNAIRLLGAHTDVTGIHAERERIQRLNAELATRARDAERESAELQRLNQELREFTRVVSHDLKSPLRAIDHLAQWAIEDSADLSDEVRGYLSKIRSRVRRMDALLTDMVLYARSSDEWPGRERVRVGELIALVVDDHSAPDSMSIVVEAEPELEVCIERKPMLHVVSILVDNAVKHHDRDQGRVGIRLGVADGHLRCTVTDDGPGIDPKYHDRVFEMFQTLKPRDAVEGSGMGLTIARKLVQKAGGQITLTSDGERGTSVSVRWPLPTAPSASNPAPDAPTSDNEEKL